MNKDSLAQWLDVVVGLREQLPECELVPELGACADREFINVLRTVDSTELTAEGGLVSANPPVEESDEDYPALLFELIDALHLDYPLARALASALADDRSEVLRKVWRWGTDTVYAEMASLLTAESRPEAYRLCEIIDVIDELDSVAEGLEIFGYNFVPLSGIHQWLARVVQVADRWLDHDDIQSLSSAKGRPPLIALTSQVPSGEWLAEEFLAGDFALSNNPKLPGHVIDQALQGLTDYEPWHYASLVFHPQADPALAKETVTRLLDSGDPDELGASWSQWDNVRDDAFRNFNDFTSLPSSAPIVEIIRKWCEEHPDLDEYVWRRGW